MVAFLVPCSKCKKECFAEFLGTYLLVVVGPGSVIVTLALRLSATESHIAIGFSFGFTVALVIFLLGKYSRAHINPAVTLAHVIARRMGNKEDFLISYLFFQVLGALVAGLTLRLIFAGSITSTELGSTKLALGIESTYGIVLEVVGTFLLALSTLVAASYIRSPLKQAILVGSSLFILILVIGPLTGASLNPARSLGPSLASGYFTNIYVYLVGPVLGGVFAGLTFRWLIRNGRRKKNNTLCVC